MQPQVKFTILLIAGLLAAAGGGCGRPPQAAPQNLQLIASLRTALSAQNPEWLEKNVAIIDQRHQAGEMSQQEYDEFQRIITIAQEGQWQEAERQTLAFLAAQRPTREQRERLAQ